jgi:predicted nucleic acid-binding protein
VIYLDSWVWLEYGLGQANEATAGEVIREARQAGGAISTIGLTEVDYVLARELDRETADAVTSGIEDLDGVHVVPVSVEVARLASKLRSKYYDRQTREFSYADAIHLATASLLECEAFHTGDSDFDGIEEVGAVIHSA